MRLALHAVTLATLLTLSHALLRHAPSMGGLLTLGRAGLTLAAIALYGVVFLYYAVLLDRYELSQLYPVYVGLSVAMVYLSGVWFFGETWSGRSILGLVFLIVGVGLVGGPGGHAPAPTTDATEEGTP